MANERYEGVGPNGHYTLAERIFTKIKSLFDTKVKTDVPANAVFTDTLPTAYCTSSADATTKVAQCTGFSLKDNSYIPINFINGNTVEAFTEVTLNINNTGAKPLYVNWSFEGGPKTSSPFDASTYIIYYTNNAYYLYTNGTLFPYKNVANITDIRYYTVDSEDNSVAVVEEQGPSLLGHPESWKVDLSVPLATTVSNGLLSAADKIKIDDFEDTKVTQTELSADEVREILIAGTSTTATITTGAAKSVGLRIHPNAKAIMEGDNTLATTFSSHAEGAGSTASGMYSHAEGYYTRANGQGTHVEGYQNFSTTATAYGGHAEGFCTTINNGPGAHAEGFHTYADGLGSHAEGYYTTAKGNFPHAEGNYVCASGDGSHAEGYKTTAKAYQSHAEGNYTYANNNFTHVEGNYSTGNGYYSHSEGDHSISSGVASHTEGCYTNATTTGAHAEGYGTSAKYNVACGTGSHAEGFGTCASGLYAHAEGENTKAIGQNSHAEGYQTCASGYYSHAEGQSTTSNSYGSHAEGYGTYASDYSSHAEGGHTTASGSYSHAEGCQTLAIAEGTHAEGYGTYAGSNYTHAEGYGTTANYSYGHAEGIYTYASGSQGAHAEGYATTASGNSGHSEGYMTKASGYQSHAEGNYTVSSGDYSHAEGARTTAGGRYSHTQGYYTQATHKSQHVFGEYNDLDASTATSTNRGTYVEIVGNGLSSTQLSNARTLDWDGNEKIAGNLTDKWGLQTSRTMFEEDFQQLTQAERDNGTNYYIPDREPLKICDYIYPVGAIYMSVNNISPAILFGGTWERIEDKFLLAAGQTYNSGATGGEAEHILSASEMPSHGHTVRLWGTAGASGVWKKWNGYGDTLINNDGGLRGAFNASWTTGSQTAAQAGNGDQAGRTDAHGGGLPHNNMPPYLVVNVWMRVPDPVQQEEEEGE